MRRVLICGLWLGVFGASMRVHAQAPVVPPIAPPTEIPAAPPQTAPALQPIAPEVPAMPAPASPVPAAPLPVEPNPAPPEAPAEPKQPEQPPAPAPPVAKPSPPPAATRTAADARDYERLPQPVLPPVPHGPFARLALGAQVALLTTGGNDSMLRLPSYAHLDLGYQFSPALALGLRLGTWLSYDKFAIAFVGVGVTHGFEPDSMFFTGVIGLSFQDPSFGIQGDEQRQGLALHLDVGQRFTLAEALYFEVGGHLELGTPWGATALEFVGIGIGPFVSVRWGS
jgi:hypothetical protein